MPDAAIANWLQNAVPVAARPVMDAATFLGGTPGWLLIIACSFWWSGSRLGLRVALVIGASSLVNVLAKWVLLQPRPYFVSDRIHALEASDGFGMPSGHSQVSASAWGAVARWSRQLSVLVLGVMLTLLIGLSRIYYGVHSTLQVLCGWALGGLVVLVAGRVEAPLSRWWARAPPAARWTAAILPSLGAIGLGLVFRALILDRWQVPLDWVVRHRATSLRLHPDADLAELRLIDLSFLARSAGGLLGTSLAALWYGSAGRPPLEVRSWPRRWIHTAVGAVALVSTFEIGGLVVRAVGDLGEVVRFAALTWVIAVAAPLLAESLCARIGFER